MIRTTRLVTTKESLIVRYSHAYRDSPHRVCDRRRAPCRTGGRELRAIVRELWTATTIVEIALNVERPDAANPFTDVVVEGRFSRPAGSR